MAHSARKYVLLVLACLAAGGTADATSFNWTQTASVAFDQPVTLTKVTDIRFGTVRALTVSTYTMSTSGTITATGSGATYPSTTGPGNVTISGSSSQTVNISVGSFVANNGVTLQNATCSYNGGAEGSCTINGAAAPGGGKTLLIGIQAVVNGSQAAGSSAAPTLVVTVNYP